MQKEIAALPGFVRLSVGQGELPALLAAYREFTSMCLNQGARAAMVVSAEGDPTTEAGLHDAMIAMRRLGVRPGFKLALVAKRPEKHRIYRLAETDSAAGGIKVRVFWNEYEASAWLMGARDTRPARAAHAVGR